MTRASEMNKPSKVECVKYLGTGCYIVSNTIILAMKKLRIPYYRRIELHDRQISRYSFDQCFTRVLFSQFCGQKTIIRTIRHSLILPQMELFDVQQFYTLHPENTILCVIGRVGIKC